jgi:hypothetical protein
MSKIKIIKDGSIQGWAVSFLITMVSVIALILSLTFDAVADRFAKVGSAWAAIVIGQFTAWLAYRTGKAIEDRKALSATPPAVPPTQ